MIRICLKCNAYYADDSLAFCFVDGTPLVKLDPSSEQWSEGVRVIEEKANVQRKLERKLKWRRVVTSTITTLMVAMFVCVVVVNGLIYLKPNQEPEKPLQQATAPTGTPSPQPSPPVTPPTPSPSLTLATTPTPTPTPTAKCSADDEAREGKSIILRFGPGWKRNIENDPPRVGEDGLPPGLGKPTLSPITYDISFSSVCNSAVVTASYKWSVQTPAELLDLKKKKKRFDCEKTGGSWRCS